MTSETPPLIPGDEPSPEFPPPAPDDRSSQLHRQLVGALGMLLPLLVWIVAGWRTTDPPHRWELLDAVSSYYHSGSVSVFTGILIALAVFLFTYRGYDNAHGRRDRIAAIIAGSAAVLVAFFPCTPPDSVTRPLWWTETMGTLHLVSAVILFGAFVFFSYFQFPLSSTKKGKPMPADKKVRNMIYRICGVAIAISIVWAGLARRARAPIFWQETSALEFFAASWLLKGRVDQTAVIAAQKTAHYGRHPGQLIGKMWKAIRGEH